MVWVSRSMYRCRGYKCIILLSWKSMNQLFDLLLLSLLSRSSSSSWTLCSKRIKYSWLLSIKVFYRCNKLKRNQNISLLDSSTSGSTTEFYCSTTPFSLVEKLPSSSSAPPNFLKIGFHSGALFSLSIFLLKNERDTRWWQGDVRKCNLHMTAHRWGCLPQNVPQGVNIMERL